MTSPCTWGENMWLSLLYIVIGDADVKGLKRVKVWFFVFMGLFSLFSLAYWKSWVQFYLQVLTVRKEDPSHNCVVAWTWTICVNLSSVGLVFIFSDSDVLRDLSMEEQMADCCPLCHMPFDKGKKRRLIDTCGHAKCYSCMFNYDSCRICENSKLNWQNY